MYVYSCWCVLFFIRKPMNLFSIVWPFLVIVWLGVLMNYKRTMKMMTEVMESKWMIFLIWMISVFFGLYILDIWVIVWWESWVVSVLGWASLIKWTLLLVFPKIMKSTSLSMVKGNDMFIQWWVFLMALFGLWISWLVYMG